MLILPNGESVARATLNKSGTSGGTLPGANIPCVTRLNFDHRKDIHFHSSFQILHFFFVVFASNTMQYAFI